MLNLPVFSWFLNIQGEIIEMNRFTGSIGTDSKTGSVNRTTFHYELEVKDDGEHQFTLYASCGWKAPWNQGGEKLCWFDETFSATPEGLDAAKTWVEEKYAASNPNL